MTFGLARGCCSNGNDHTKLTCHNWRLCIVVPSKWQSMFAEHGIHLFATAAELRLSGFLLIAVDDARSRPREPRGRVRTFNFR